MASLSDTTVVVPTYNEVDNLTQVVTGVIRHGYRMLVVDDASPDGTGELADRLAAEHPEVAVLHRGEKQGLGPAYAAGFVAALDSGAEIVCEMDADLSHDPARLPALVEAVRGGADLALGSRFVPGGEIVDWPARRRFLSRWGNRYARIMLGTSIHDMTGGFRAFRAEALRRLDPETCNAAGYTFQVEMAWRAHRAGMEIVEVPITFRERQRGDSKLNREIVLEAMWLVTRWGLRRVFGRAPAGGPADPHRPE
jgi:dolichol-phosphate mannosyltransferase